MISVKLPDGTVVKNVPENTSKSDLVSKLVRGGVITQEKAKELIPPVETGGVFGLFEGEAEFDAPEVPPFVKAGERTVNVGDALKMARTNPLVAAQIFQQQTGIEPQFDAFGNPFVELEVPTDLKGGAENKRFFLNKPGLSRQDVRGLLGEAAFLGLSGGIAGGAASTLRLLPRVLAVGGGTGAGSIAQDLFAGQAGSEEGVNIPRVLTEAAFGAGGELVAPLVFRFLRRVLNNPRFIREGALTDEGRRRVEDVGIDPDSLTEEAIERFRMAKTPEEARRIAQAESLPRPVRLSRGDITREPGQQSFELRAQAGAEGGPAARTVEGFRKEQQEAIRANVPEIQERLTGRPDFSELQGMQALQQRLAEERAALKQAVDDAYEGARQGDLRILREGVDALEAYISNGLQSFNTTTAPKTFGTVEQLGQIERVLRAKKAEKVAEVDFRALEAVRQQLKALQRSNDNVERAAATRAARRFDEYLDELIDTGLARGDLATLEQMKGARQLRAELSKKFESDRIIESITRVGDDGVLEIAPSEALNKIFAANTLGGKTGSRQALQQLKGLLGENSEEWLSMKGEGFVRLLASQGRGNVRGADLMREFSGNKFATALDDALRKNPELMETLYTKAELDLLRNFRDVALRATAQGKFAGNPSRTAFELARMAEDVFGSQERLLLAIGRRLSDRVLSVRGAGRRARLAVKPPPKRIPARPQTIRGVPAGTVTGGVSGATAGAIGSATGAEQER